MPVLEPTREVYGGGGPARAAKRLVWSTRPLFLTASALPVIFGTAYGARVAGAFDVLAFALALMATMLVGAAANVLNDVCDDASGADPGNEDRLHPFTGGSRFIQNGVMTRTEMARWAAVLLGLAVAAGALLTLLKGPAVVLFGLCGLALAVAYSMPPLALSGRGLGELTVAAAFGPLPVAGAVWLQSGRLEPTVLLVALPVAAWVCNILVINEVPDAEADARAGKATLAVRLGRPGTRRLYLGLHALAAAGTLVAAALGLLPWLAVAAPLAIAAAAVPASRAIAAGAGSERLLGGIRFTLAAHALGTLWLSACALLA